MHDNAICYPHDMLLYMSIRGKHVTIKDKKKVHPRFLSATCDELSNYFSESSILL